MHPGPSEPSSLSKAPASRDLTDPTRGFHAMQLLVEDAEIALRNAWRCRAIVRRGAPPAQFLRQLSPCSPEDLLVSCPRVASRQAGVGRWQTDAPHDLELWRVRSDRPFSLDGPESMVQCVMAALLPERSFRTIPIERPSTFGTVRVEVQDGREWIEVGECGLVRSSVLATAGLPAERCFAIAMRLTLDHVLMLRKGIHDIRVLRSNDPSVRVQMRDLAKYQPKEPPDTSPEHSCRAAMARTSPD